MTAQTGPSALALIALVACACVMTFLAVVLLVVNRSTRMRLIVAGMFVAVAACCWPIVHAGIYSRFVASSLTGPTLSVSTDQIDTLLADEYGVHIERADAEEPGAFVMRDADGHELTGCTYVLGSHERNVHLVSLTCDQQVTRVK